MKTKAELHKHFKENRVKDVLKGGNAFYYYSPQINPNKGQMMLELSMGFSGGRTFYVAQTKNETFEYLTFESLERKTLELINKYNMK